MEETNKASTPPYLSLIDIHVCYNNVEALHGVSLHANKGEIVTILGANGAGKTTLLMALSGLIKLNSGSIIFEDEPIHPLPSFKIVQRGIIQSPEGRRIFGTLSVTENLLLGAFTRKETKQISLDMDWIFTMFPRLKERKNQLAGTLSGGEQQMLAIGRALMGAPKVLLLDEPSLGLAPILVSAIWDTIREIKKTGLTILLVEQNARAALKLADRGYVMETGKIVLEDSAINLLKNTAVQKAYLGDL